MVENCSEKKMSFKKEWFIRRGYFLWVLLRLASRRELLEMSWFFMDLYLSHAQFKCVCLQNSFAKPALVASYFSGDNRKVTMKLNTPTLVDSWALLLNNGEGGRAGSRLEQSNVWALKPGRLRWESWCFIVRCEEAWGSWCLSSLPVDWMDTGAKLGCDTAHQSQKLHRANRSPLCRGALQSAVA